MQEAIDLFYNKLKEVILDKEIALSILINYILIYNRILYSEFGNLIYVYFEKMV